MVSEIMVMEALKQCFDPEIPVNVVDLGLIYSVQIEGSNVDIQMTLTAKGSHVLLYQRRRPIESFGRRRSGTCSGEYRLGTPLVSGYDHTGRSP